MLHVFNNMFKMKTIRTSLDLGLGLCCFIFMTTFILLFTLLSLILLFILFPYLVYKIHISSNFLSWLLFSTDLLFQSFPSLLTVYGHGIHLQCHISIKTAYPEKITVLLN